MKCKKCSQKAVYLQPTLCKTHFCAYVEKKVDSTIKKYKLITKKDKVVVGVSGGKDSLTVLYLLRKYNKNIIALCIDEGIKGYRASTIKDMKAFCKQYDIPYHIVSYKEEFGYTLDQMLKKLDVKPCTICGAFRRYLLNTKARSLGATKLVTGHNADDEAQAVIMNLLRHQVEVLPRLGPLTGVLRDPLFVPRVKPLYFVTEKEIATYTFIKSFGVRYVECPNAVESYRSDVGDFLNDLEKEYPGTKKAMLERFVKSLPKLREVYKPTSPLKHCKACSEPCMQRLCKACQFVQQLQVEA